MEQGYIDNRTKLIKDDLVETLQQGDRISIAASLFSMYAYRELKDKLESIDDFRFIFTEDAFTKQQTPKEQREFYIPRLARERSLYGTDLEIKLRNELTQKAVALECVDWIRRKQARFLSSKDESLSQMSFMGIQGDNRAIGYTPFAEFSTSQLGTTRHAKRPPIGAARLGAEQVEGFLDTFEHVWRSGDAEDVTEEVIRNIEQMYRENPPELIYYLALYRIFNEFLTDIDEDTLPKEGTGYRQSRIWNKLYNFQKDAALAIINKLETYKGCILADSVGLGKTFTALAVIKYFESRNRNVLVLSPKKLKDNWMTYRSNVRNNILRDDHLRYDVLFHTDLSRTGGPSNMGINIDQIDWGNYDLVVIDESHNFRNGTDSSAKAENKENRYHKLLEKVIRQGVETKVLMLSATPVNNRFRDLQNQLALAYEGNDENWTEKLGLSTDIENVFRNAQATYGSWSKLDADERTTKNLMDMLDFDFFKILDQVTVARSRRHITKYYDTNEIGHFPSRVKPQTIRPDLTTNADLTYDRIYDELDALNLSVYIPSEKILPTRMAKYLDSDAIKGLTTKGREQGIRKLMATNLLKRFESSVHSFRCTLKRVLGYMEQTVRQIDDFEQHRMEHGQSHHSIELDEYQTNDDWDADDAETVEFATLGKQSIDLADMDWMSWRSEIQQDINVITALLAELEPIDADHDAKLQRLFKTIRDKADEPINPGNRKVLIFTAFADTADYLYEHVGAYAHTLGLETAEVTGTGHGKCTLKRVSGDMNDILTCFSPASKERALTSPQLEGNDIDILIATDCISEGQNLQDCDMVVNYDIHWNPVRIVQRFGRIDRIGSKNDSIQLVNFWPNVDLDKYLRLKDRVEARMRLTVMTSTGDDDYINEDEHGDLAYRERQLKQMQNEVPDLEDVDGGISITDLGLNNFRMDLIEYHRSNPDIEHVPNGINAVVEGDEPGILFVLRNVNNAINIQGKNQLHPFYLMYVKDDGVILHGYADAKTCLDVMRGLCKGKSTYDERLCDVYNNLTRNGKDMKHASDLLKAAVSGIVEQSEQSAQDLFLSSGLSSFLDPAIEGLNDFELVCFLAVLPGSGR